MRLVAIKHHTAKVNFANDFPIEHMRHKSCTHLFITTKFPGQRVSFTDVCIPRTVMSTQRNLDIYSSGAKRSTWLVGKPDLFSRACPHVF